MSEKNNTKQYSERDIESLDAYMTHVMAMTAEQLNGKSKIAAELAWRDSQIAALQQKLDAMAESMPSLNDEERQKYMDAISTNMRSISEERDENLQFEYDILRLARAALITHDTADKAG